MPRLHFWLSLVIGGLAAPLPAGEELSAMTFARIHALIRPGEGESRWFEVPWLTSVWEAREKAAEQGKPILIWSGGGAAPIGGC